DLPPAVGVEQRAAGGQLGEQGDGQHAADDTGTSTHRDLHGKWRNYTRVCCRFVRGPRRSLFLREARREEGSLVIPNERRGTPRRAKTGPARRGARQIAPCGVAELGKGAPLPASRALPGAIWRCNAARDETATDPSTALIFR